MIGRKLIVVISLITLILVSGCTLLPPNERVATGPQRTSNDEATPTPIPTPIVPTKPVYEVRRGEVINIVQFSGRIAPAQEEELFFKTAGRVRNIFIERDDIITQGQVLADLEIDDLERDLTSAQLDLEQAEQQKAEAEQLHNDDLSRAQLSLAVDEARLAQSLHDHEYSLTRARINLNIKQLQLAKAQGQDISAREILVKADLTEAEIELRQAQIAYDQVSYRDDLGTSSQAVRLQQATIDHERAEANYDLAMQELNNQDVDLSLLVQEVALAELEVAKLEEGGDFIEDEQAVRLAQLQVEILERGVDPIYANNVERAKLDVEKLEAAIEDAQIIAPFDGEVLTLSLTDGRDVEPYRPVVIVADPSELEISADPIEAQLRELTEGIAVEIWANSRPGDRYTGTIYRLPYPYGGGGRTEGVENEDQSTRISMDIPIGETGFEQGDLVRVEAILEEKDDVLWLPPQAIRVFEGRRFVVVQDGEAQRRVDVRVGIEGEERVEIEEGLNEGDIIVGQ